MKEIFKDIKGFERHYQVSNFGKIKNLDYRSTGKGIILKGCVNKDGYSQITLAQKSYLVHRLVALAFLPNPKNKETVNHINGIKTDNQLKNLEWATIKENNEHAYRTGLSDNTGVKNGRSKLTEKEVLEIRDLVKSKRFTLKEIRSLYSHSNISCIKTRRCWGHL